MTGENIGTSLNSKPVSELWIDAYYVNEHAKSPASSANVRCDVAEVAENTNLEDFLYWVDADTLPNLTSFYELDTASVAEARGRYLGSIAITPGTQSELELVGFRRVVTDGWYGSWLGEGEREASDLAWYLRPFHPKVPVILPDVYSNPDIPQTVSHGVYLGNNTGESGGRTRPVYAGLHVDESRSGGYVEQLFPFEGRDKVEFDLSRLFPHVNFALEREQRGE